jgi:hypothetical protein
MPSRLLNSVLALRRHLDRVLFVEGPASPTRLGRLEIGILVVAFFALSVVLLLLRAGPEEALNSLWAEDGPILLQEAHASPFLDAVFDPYASYLVFVPRLIGEVWAAFPLLDAPAAMAIAAALVTALSGLAVWLGSGGLLRDPVLRATLVALTVLSPVASLESVATGAYVPWYMLFACFWLLLWRPRSWWGVGFAAAFLLATGLSTPGVWFFLPLAALRALAARDARDWAIVAAFGAGALVQLPVLALNDEPQVEPLWSPMVWDAFLQRVLDGAAFGEKIGGQLWRSFGWPFLIALTAAFLAAFALAMAKGSAAVRWVAGIAVPTALVMFLASAYQRALGDALAWPQDFSFGDGGRYAIVPALLLLSAAMVAIDRLPLRRLRGGTTWAALAVVAVLFAGLVAAFDVRNPAGRGEPPWDEALTAAAATCRAENLPETTIPISPPPFGLVLSCAEIEASGR